MATSLIDLRHARNSAPDDLPRLQAYLAQLIGEQFRLARVSYGDELTLHFGELRPARSPKLKGRLFGTYILGFRGSPWVLKSDKGSLALSAGIELHNLPNIGGKLIRKEELERDPLIQAGSRVVAAAVFPVEPVHGIGLQLQFSDGCSVLILPTESDVDAPDDANLPEIADWELLSPNGLLSAGPGPNWSFKPSSKSE